MLVRITGCASGQGWYKGRTGDVFFVKSIQPGQRSDSFDNNYYQVVGQYPPYQGCELFIPIYDCEDITQVNRNFLIKEILNENKDN